MNRSIRDNQMHEEGAIEGGDQEMVAPPNQAHAEAFQSEEQSGG